MTRFRYVMVTAAATLGIAIAGFVPTAPRLLWNASASVPIGFYTVAPADRIEMPDLVAVMPPEPFASYMVDRGYVARDVPLLKRVIGLPGDTVQLVGGQVILNGQPLPQTPNGVFSEPKLPQGPGRTLPRCWNEPVPEGGACEKQRFTETLPNGVAHDVLNILDGWPLDDTPVFTVPAGNYFFMGDNRDNSEDSRVPAIAGGLGFVPAEYLIGRADRVMFSSAGSSLLYFWTWRADRFFRAIH